MEFEQWFSQNHKALQCNPKSQKFSFADFMENSFSTTNTSISIHRGDVWYGKIHNKSKKRPFLIYQNDFLNRCCQMGEYASVIVIPLSSNIIQTTLRVLIPQRDNLKKDSQIVCNAIGLISVDKLLLKATTLTNSELQTVDKVVTNILGIKD
ncbi:MAG: type II toxin-antitoxin system PemK/MazF family toxin [Epsilonproteobacteria bacterium]|nr:type II toxin-antitoxin system PemK/MazF family toxin [Campylobacterota bacterium]